MMQYGGSLAFRILGKFSIMVFCSPLRLCWLETYGLLASMWFYYMQLWHVIMAQSRNSDWSVSSTPFFNFKEGITSKGFISQAKKKMLDKKNNNVVILLFTIQNTPSVS